MAHTTWSVERAADVLLDGEAATRDRAPITEEWPGLDPAAGYGVQAETLRRRLAAGQRITGVKLGLTSRAKQRTMGVDTPLTGWLTDAMALSDGLLPAGRFIHPRAEPEIVFIMGSRLSGPDATAESALAAVAEVRAGIEIIDSRYRDFRFTLADVIADNASSGGYVIASHGVSPQDVDVVTERCALDVDGLGVGTATGAAILGDPAYALAQAVNNLGSRGHAIEPGWIVFTGGLLDAVPLTGVSNVRARFGSLGEVALTVGG